MSYRYYLYKFPREFVCKLSGAETVEQAAEILSAAYPKSVEEWDGKKHFSLYEVGEEIFELGSDFREFNDLYNHSASFFAVPEVAEIFQEYGLRICEKNGVLALIDAQRKRIQGYFKSLLDGSEDERKKAVYDKYNEWSLFSEKMQMDATDYDNKMLPYDLDVNSDTLVRSWKYEYQIFELVRQYKNIDWEKEVVVLLGW